MATDGPVKLPGPLGLLLRAATPLLIPGVAGWLPWPSTSVAFKPRPGTRSRLVCSQVPARRCPQVDREPLLDCSS